MPFSESPTLQTLLARRLNRRRLLESREEAELRGSVTQAAEIEHLLVALEPPIGSLRAAAVSASRRSAQVVPLRRAAGA